MCGYLPCLHLGTVTNSLSFQTSIPTGRLFSGINSSLASAYSRRVLDGNKKSKIFHENFSSKIKVAVVVDRTRTKIQITRWFCILIEVKYAKSYLLIKVPFSFNKARVHKLEQEILTYHILPVYILITDDIFYFLLMS